MLFRSQQIPLAVLAGILTVVCYNMSEIHTFSRLLKGPRPVSYTHLDVYKRQEFAHSLPQLDGLCQPDDVKRRGLRQFQYHAGMLLSLIHIYGRGGIPGGRLLRFRPVRPEPGEEI